MRRFDLRHPEFRYDESDPAGFRAGMVRPGPSLGATATGISMYEVPPGEAVCPLHWEAGEEEWAMSVDGPMWVRDQDGTHRAEAFELVFFPRGPEGVHQIRNDGDAPVRVLMFGETSTPGASFYPDSGKVGIWTGTPSADGLFVHATNVPYFEGESGDASP
jgi:uncharacterized cupin superfamily protein